MDAAGVGKIITISQAVFEGMTPRTDEDCAEYTDKKPGGCRCTKDDECIISEFQAKYLYILVHPRHEVRNLISQ